MPVVTNIADLREMARKRVAKAVFDYVDRGSYDERTLLANRADLEALVFRQRVGSTWTAFHAHNDGRTGLGEPWRARSADRPQLGDARCRRARGRKVGIPVTISTMSICSIEDGRARDQALRVKLYLCATAAFRSLMRPRREMLGVALTMALKSRASAQDLKTEWCAAAAHPKCRCSVLSCIHGRWRVGRAHLSQ